MLLCHKWRNGYNVERRRRNALHVLMPRGSSREEVNCASAMAQQWRRKRRRRAEKRAFASSDKILLARGSTALLNVVAKTFLSQWLLFFCQDGKKLNFPCAAAHPFDGTAPGCVQYGLQSIRPTALSSQKRKRWRNSPFLREFACEQSWRMPHAEIVSQRIKPSLYIEANASIWLVSPFAEKDRFHGFLKVVLSQV